MTPEERRERLANYWTHYYDELRRQLSNYTTNPESVPHALRGHERRIQARECKDGYVIVHFPDPENVHSSDHPERLELITDHQNTTVGELMGREIPKGSLLSDTPFWVTRSVHKERHDGRVPTNGTVGAPRPDHQPPDRTMERAV